ncbi:MAG: tetratricopeptide repeat protein [Vicinamibacterales bacterium]
MKQVIAAAGRVVFALGILGAVVLVNRSQSGDEASAESIRCEIDPPRDIAGLEACLARSPRDLELVLELAAAYEAAGRHPEARAQHERAVAIDPRDADARRRLGDRQ